MHKNVVTTYDNFMGNDLWELCMIKTLKQDAKESLTQA